MRRRSALVLAALAACGCNKSPSSGGTAHHDMAMGPGSSSSFDLSCAGVGQKAMLVPVNLVVLLDRSGSMGDGTNGDPTLKWDPVTAGLDAFFADPDSAGMQAALGFFSNPFATSLIDECNPGEYFVPPPVPMMPLPDTTTFSAKIAQVMPMGDTPTKPALDGAIGYAQQLQMTSTARTAIVLVTDGEPDTCDSSVQDVALDAAKVAADIPTYVIGVGDNIAGLNDIAMSGGTGQATFVSVGDATQTKNDFLTALEDIRGLVLKCEFPVPSPPANMTLDFSKVNVLYTPSNAAQIELQYDANCANGTGWIYDDPKKPTKVQLCPQTCTTVRADHGGAIDVVFGCTTDGNLIS
jgi:hypothetical protein